MLIIVPILTKKALHCRRLSNYLELLAHATPLPQRPRLHGSMMHTMTTALSTAVQVAANSRERQGHSETVVAGQLREERRGAAHQGTGFTFALRSRRAHHPAALLVWTSNTRPRQAFWSFYLPLKNTQTNLESALRYSVGTDSIAYIIDDDCCDDRPAFGSTTLCCRGCSPVASPAAPSFHKTHSGRRVSPAVIWILCQH